MLGMVRWQEQGRAQLERVQVCGMSVLCVGVKRMSRSESRRAAKRLYRAGVRRMLKGVPGQPELPGFPFVEEQDLYRAVADRLILADLRRKRIEPERASIILRGEYPDGDLVAAAYALCPRVRQVVIDTERGGEGMQKSLLRQFGVAIGPVNEGGEVLSVRFSGESRGEDLALCNGVELDGLQVDVPQLILPETLARVGALCALWQAGLLTLQQVCICESGQENKCT